MSEKRVVEFEGMTFTHHVTHDGIPKGWRHEEGNEWVGAVEKMYLNEILKRGDRITQLEAEREAVVKVVEAAEALLSRRLESLHDIDGNRLRIATSRYRREYPTTSTEEAP